nr:phosphoheptose isomerase-like [Hydra vulgaris]
MYQNGGKLLIAGNGGSASDAQHFSGELMAKFSEERKPLPAIALHCDTSSLTAWSNDYSFHSFYERAVDGLGKIGDIFFAISTSGNSKNIINAAIMSKKKGLYVIGLLGKNGGELKNYCDLFLTVPSNQTPRIQESHILVIHIICQLIDNAFTK